MDEIQKWVCQRAYELTLAELTAPMDAHSRETITPDNFRNPLYPAAVAFARYIQSHEDAPVDPLVLEARKIVECTVHWSPQTDLAIQEGRNDITPEMTIALACLRRGIEIAKQGEG